MPQSREQAAAAVGRIGTLRREIDARKAAKDEKVRQAGEELEREIAPLVEEMGQQVEGIQVYCEANRTALTNDGRVKYHDFGTGRVSWRQRPPKVSVSNVKAIIEHCKKFGLKAFLREKVEINKDAMLADPDTAQMITGVSISSDGEDFVIETAELQTAGAEG
ncbi:host-nuclease inhibitor Gam family protein [Phyllobacterium leguminum]|uniref:host-nuclease inhibitor Gam family protein n=1 Tax=Phyllobacterium leguminum TaxID=314237 RepID=UPI001FDFE740|nr:host-nuclease inhibitor Gam family protein [Phyllobacterium leguminum]